MPYLRSITFLSIIAGIALSSAFVFAQDQPNKNYIPQAFKNGTFSNQPPQVEAGNVQTIVLPMTASLEGVVSDDGLPNHTLKTTWSQMQGVAAVTFSASDHAVSQATFTQRGVYVLMLNATDGELTSSDTVTITVLPSRPSAAETKAYQHLAAVMDKFHQTVDVYTDAGAAGNNFVHRAKIIPPNQSGNGLTLNDGYTGTVYTGATSILNHYQPSFDSTAGGWYFMVGMLEGNELIPKDNWGTYPNAGYDLTGATELSFWAKGAKGGEKIEFFAFGVGRTPSGQPETDKPYPDSEVKTTTCGRGKSCYVELTDSWQPYTILITNTQALTNVLGGFGWFTTAAINNNQAITFYLDEIRYNKPNLDAPRFLVSFETLPSGADFDTVMGNVSFIYDDALVLMNFVQAGDQRRARLVANAFVYAQKHDRYYFGDRYDGRLRNTYQAGDLTTPPGWAPNGQTGTARLPGWWAPNVGDNGAWLEDGKFIGSDTGNLSWVILALLTYYEEYGGESYLNAAIDLGNWIAASTYDERGAGGFMGGYSGHEVNPQKETWKSTEHNLDLIAAFERLYWLTKEERWHTLSLHARRFVEAMWIEDPNPRQQMLTNPGCHDANITWRQDRNGGFFWTGVGTDGVTVNEQAIPLDGQTWALMVLGRNAWTERAIAFAEKNHAVRYTHNQHQFDGFDFNEDRDLPWMEGTGQMVVAYQMLEQWEKSWYYLDELVEIQEHAPHTNTLGLVAAPKDGLTNGFNWCYFNRLHVGATAWFIMAQQGYNPYWHKASPPVIAPYSSRVAGPTVGKPGISYTFTGTVVALTALSPITYHWTATDQAGQDHVGIISDTITLMWSTPGMKQVTLTVDSALGRSIYRYMIDIQMDSPILYRLHGLNFGPYVDGSNPDTGGPIAESTLQTLLQQIAPYTTWVRTYGCDAGLETAGRIAHDLKRKIAMGAWLGANLAANEQQLACLIARAQAGDVDLAVVGSETLYRKELAPAQLISYIQRFRAAVPNTPVTTADVYDRIVQNPEIMNAVDVILVNLYPYWERFKLDHAVAQVHGRYQYLQKIARGKPIILSETGWPSCGAQQGAAIASPENAAFYFRNLISWARSQDVSVFYFEAFDEPWKAAVEGPQGACWGIWDKNGTLKNGMKAVFTGETMADNWSGRVVPCAGTEPQITFTAVPAYGSFANLRGRVCGVLTGEHRVAVYIRVNGQWWLKPLFEEPLTWINPDGNWEADITTGGTDERADAIQAFLIKLDQWPVDGPPPPPAQVATFAVAKVEVSRNPQEAAARSR